MHTDVMWRIGAAAAQVAAQEKQAAFGLGAARRGLGAVGGAFKNVLGPAVSRPLRAAGPRTAAGAAPLSPGRAFSPWRTLGSAAAAGGAVGTGALAAGHAVNAVQNGDPARQFQNAQGHYQAMLADQQQKIQQRAAYEDSASFNSPFNRFGRWLGLGGDSADALRRQAASGEFGSDTSFGGLNPWGHGNAAAELGRAQQATQTMHQKYQNLVAQQPPPELAELQRLRPTAVLPEQRAFLDQEIARLQAAGAGRGPDSAAAKQLRDQMQSLGMLDPWRAGQASGPPEPPPHLRDPAGPPAPWSGPDEPAPAPAPQPQLPYAQLAADPWYNDPNQRVVDPLNGQYGGFQAR